MFLGIKSLCTFDYIFSKNSIKSVGLNIDGILDGRYEYTIINLNTESVKRMQKRQTGGFLQEDIYTQFG